MESADNNPIKASHRQDAKSNHCTLCFDKSPLKDFVKNPLHLGFHIALLGLASMSNVCFSFPYGNA
jgi:hypothetical protein